MVVAVVGPIPASVPSPIRIAVGVAHEAGAVEHFPSPRQWKSLPKHPTNSLFYLEALDGLGFDAARVTKSLAASDGTDLVGRLDHAFGCEVRHDVDPIS